MTLATGGFKSRGRAAVREIAAIVLLLLLSAVATGCGPQEEELSGRIGAGSGGPAVTGPFELHTLQSGDGTTIGEFGYDSPGFFLLDNHPIPEMPELHLVATITPAAFLIDLADDGNINSLASGDVVIVATRISGRPDTPCRYQAAVQARDEGYKIMASGDVKNANGVEFHQVNLRKGALRQRFYCADLRLNSGVMFNIFTPSSAEQDFLQTHYVLNSVVRQ